MHHLIFIDGQPDNTPATAEQLAAVGMEDHAQGALSVKCVGPTGKGGTLFGWVPGKLHYNATEQDWFPAVPSGDRPAGRYWVGTWKASPVTEQDVRRPYRYGGKELQLGNGDSWLIPTPAELPHTAKLADDGTWRFVIQRQFHDYYLKAMRWVDEAADGGARLTLLDMIAFSVEALSLNYRMPPELISEMGLLDQVTAAKAWTMATGLEMES